MAEELWIIRHGETEWSRQGRHTGLTDVPLTAHGEDAARGLASRLAATRFDLVLTSPRLRARRTAELAGFPDARVEDGLAEWEYGDYEGATTVAILEIDPGWTIWEGHPPGGENAEQIAARLDEVLATVAAQDGRVLAFGHGHCMRVLAARWLGHPARDGALFRLDTATVSVLGHEHGRPVVARWNG